MDRIDFVQGSHKPCNVELRGPYSNTKAQVSALEALLRKLPGPDDAAVRPSQGRRRSGRAKQLDAHEVQQLVADYEAGATVYELGDRYGISRQTVSKILKGEDVAMRRQGLTAEQVDEAVGLYESGWSVARIGARLEVGATTVLVRLRERGVRMRGAQGRA